MSVFDEAVATLATHPEIAELFAATSTGDRSVAFQLLDSENSAAVTSQDSPNHRLWRRFEDHGWMILVESNVGGDAPVRFYEARLTELGRRFLPVVFSQMTLDSL